MEEEWSDELNTVAALEADRTFNVAVIRQNQLLKGDFESMRFVFLNEEY